MGDDGPVGLCFSKQGEFSLVPACEVMVSNGHSQRKEENSKSASEQEEKERQREKERWREEERNKERKKKRRMEGGEGRGIKSSHSVTWPVSVV